MSKTFYANELGVRSLKFTDDS